MSMLLRDIRYIMTIAIIPGIIPNLANNIEYTTIENPKQLLEMDEIVFIEEFPPHIDYLALTIKICFSKFVKLISSLTSVIFSSTTKLSTGIVINNYFKLFNFLLLYFHRLHFLVDL